MNSITPINYQPKIQHKYEEKTAATQPAFRGAEKLIKPNIITALIPFAGIASYLGIKTIDKNYENKVLIKQFDNALKNGFNKKPENFSSSYLNQKHRFILNDNETVKFVKLGDKNLYKSGNKYILTDYDDKTGIETLEMFNSKGVLEEVYKEGPYRLKTRVNMALRTKYSNYKMNPDGTYTRKVSTKGDIELINGKRLEIIHDSGIHTFAADGDSEYESVQTLNKDGELINEHGVFKNLLSYHTGTTTLDSDKKFITVKSPNGIVFAIPNKDGKIELNMKKMYPEYDSKDFTYLNGKPLFVSEQDEKRRFEFGRYLKFYDNVAKSAPISID